MGSTRGTRALAEEYWGGSSFRWNDKHCFGGEEIPAFADRTF